MLNWGLGVFGGVGDWMCVMIMGGVFIIGDGVICYCGVGNVVMMGDSMFELGLVLIS